ncbi:MAG: nuclear transport factor 2 family protein [Pseudomonadota bacterium]
MTDETHENSNLRALEDGYKLWSAKDPAAVDYFLKLVHENVSWRSLADGAEAVEFTRAQTGVDGVRSYLEGLIADWELESYRVDEYVTQGDTIVVLAHCKFTHRRTGVVLDTPKADIWKFKDGRVISFFELYDTHNFVMAARS